MERGTKVVFTGDVTEHQIRWGSHTDPRGILDTKTIYTVKKIEVHSFHTRVFLEGIKGYFNSVWFKIKK